MADPGGVLTAPGSALVRGTRPRQWGKNLLVVVAPLAAGRLLEPAVAVDTLIALVSFTVVSGAVYLVNDVADADDDRRHPTKRRRPVANGDLSPRLALVAALALALLGMALAFIASVGLVWVLVTYVAIQGTYTLWLKDEPVFDIALVSSGFLLRAIAGGVASGIELSQWFLLASVFGSLFVAAGKRYSEAHLAETLDSVTRPALQAYSPSYLRFVWGTAAATLIMTYGLWAFELREATGSLLAPVSMAPFVLAVLRYAVDIDSAGAGEPETLFLRDRVLQALGVIWLVTMVGALYVTW